MNMSNVMCTQKYGFGTKLASSKVLNHNYSYIKDSAHIDHTTENTMLLAYVIVVAFILGGGLLVARTTMDHRK